MIPEIVVDTSIFMIKIYNLLDTTKILLLFLSLIFYFVFYFIFSKENFVFAVIITNFLQAREIAT